MTLSVKVGPDGVPYVPIGKHEFKLELENLHGEFKEKAENDLKETPERMEEGLKRFRELVHAENGLNIPVDDDNFLIKFIRPFRCNADLGFKMMKKFYKFKVKYPKYGGIRVNPQEVRHVFDSDVFVFMPSRSKNGARIMLINAGAKWNPKKVKLEEMFRAVMVSIEIAMMEPKTQVGGVHVIINLEGLALHHIYQFTPSMAKLIIDWVTECAPVRLRNIHIIKQPFIFNILYNIFKPFLGDYLKKRLIFHGNDMTQLAEIIGKENLPEWLGGNADNPDYVPGPLFSDMMFYYEDQFKVFNTYGYITEKDRLIDFEEKKEKQLLQNGVIAEAERIA